jgi:hypothetical protein
VSERTPRLAAALAGALLACAAPAGAQTTGTGNPLPGTAVDPPTIGVAATPQPVGAPPVPQHPHMAPDERSNLHNDAYQTDANARSGPLGRDVRVTSAAYNGVCASVTFDREGRIVTVCVGLDHVTLRLLDPVTLRSLASFALPGRQPGSGGFGNPFQNFSGGGYFFLDHRDRAVVPTSTRRVLTVAVGPGPAFAVQRDVDLSRVVPQGDAIISVLPDWEGRLWFASRGGVVGTIAHDDTVRARDLGEPIGNSFAVAADGIYLVSDVANYLLRAGADGAPETVWRTPYANDGTQKPGQSQAGSGTTPTIIGPDLVAITDNDDPVHVVVMRRRDGRTLCRAPVFAPGASSTDQSLVTDGRSVMAENNFGFDGPPSVLGGRSTTPGLARVEIDRASGGCHVRWTNTAETAPSVVPKLARGAGLVYTYTKPPGDPADAWYLTALDWRTGASVFRVLAGRGPLFNNNYAPVTLGPDGTAYVGVIGGLVALRDAGGVDVPAGPAAPIADPVDGAAAPAARPPSRVGVRITCGRRRTAIVRVTGARIKRVSVRGRRDGRRPFAVRVRARGSVRVVVDRRDGSRRVIAKRIPRRCR